MSRSRNEVDGLTIVVEATYTKDCDEDEELTAMVTPKDEEGKH